MQGVLRLRSREYGCCWVPVFVSTQQRKNSEVYWPVSLTLTQLTCIVCTATQPIPQVAFLNCQCIFEVLKPVIMRDLAQIMQCLLTMHKSVIMLNFTQAMQCFLTMLSYGYRGCWRAVSAAIAFSSLPLICCTLCCMNCACLNDP